MRLHRVRVTTLCLITAVMLVIAPAGADDAKTPQPQRSPAPQIIPSVQQIYAEALAPRRPWTVTDWARRTVSNSFIRTEFQAGALDRREADEPDIADLGADWSRGLEVTASVDRKEFRQLQRVRVICKTKNVSEGHLWRPVCGANRYLETRIRVFDIRGKLVPMTDFYNNEGRWPVTIGGGAPLSAINPGDSSQIDLVPNLIYDMTRPGEYWVLVEFPFFSSSPPDHKEGFLYARAEPIKVKVVPEPLVFRPGPNSVPEPDRP